MVQSLTSGQRLSIAALASAGLMIWIQALPASAQSWENAPRSERRQPWGPERRTTKVDEAVLTRPPQQPLMAVISLTDQRITVYDANGRVLRSPVSTGSTGYETPAGLFTVIQKKRDHASNIYEGAPMPFMQRITWSGIALHAGELPGYPASHGCVRLPYKFAENLFDLSQKGMRVALVRDDISPVEFVHPALFSPPPTSARIVMNAPPFSDKSEPRMRLGATEAASQLDKIRDAANEKTAAAEAAAKIALQARGEANRLSQEAAKDVVFLQTAERLKADVAARVKQLDAMLAAAKYPAEKTRIEKVVEETRKRLESAEEKLALLNANPKLAAARSAEKSAVAAEEAHKQIAEEAKSLRHRLLPISVLISRETQKLYVRQGLDPVLEVPVTIRDADKPIGTTLFTALGYSQDGAKVRWNALAMYVRGAEPNPSKPSVRRASKSPEPTPTDAEEAKSVLDRIEIPKEARDRISEVVAPGSSLIVTDHEMSKETGGGTDFIVVMPGEPQGGLTIRPKVSAAPAYRGNRDDDEDRPRASRRDRMFNDWWW